MSSELTELLAMSGWLLTMRTGGVRLTFRLRCGEAGA